MNKTRRLDFSDVSLYAVTPRTTNVEGLLETTRRLLEGGVDALQFRSYDFADREYLSVGQKLKKLCQDFEALFFVNNRVDLALVLDSDGIHLGHNDMPLEKARQILGHRRIIGASTHSIPQAIEAQRMGADYVSCGPIWATPTKADYAPVGLNLIGFYRATLRIPFVAIGGIDENNVDEVLAAGAEKIAVVRALFEAKDPKAAAENFLSKINSSVNKSPILV